MPACVVGILFAIAAALFLASAGVKRKTLSALLFALGAAAAILAIVIGIWEYLQ